MSLINYWPRDEFIGQCIRTEAEELAEHVLLAVHEPMQLLRVGSGEDQLCNEDDLLKHFLSVERPIPIIGKSGVGKSHLIRWIDAKLKLHADYASLHVVRIPKNASLRQALEILLAGLEGDEFDQARKRIHSVGEQLQTEEVADLLLTFMSQQLQRLHQSASLEMQALRERPEDREKLTGSQKQRLQDIQKYTLPGQGLSELITDSNFKRNLLGPEHCIYQSARRLTQGANDEELSDNDYHVKAKDLDFSFNLDDLSLSARLCVSKTRLNTEVEARESAARVLNEVLGDSTRTAFQQLFQFNGGSFQDLFKSVRRSLKLKNRTMVILVEDMAAISAIEDVLIDSLLEESIRGGEQELCTLRSAIAVTDGYQGYLRRQDTIKTRAQYEWYIRDYGLDRTQTLERITDFCGRYLNAARYGSLALKASWADWTGGVWPPVWSDPNDDGEELKAFGVSLSGAPLFPFNRNAIEALADKFCRKGEEDLKFNPRQILNEVLLRTLRDYRHLYQTREFPPAEFSGAKVRVGLSSSLQKIEYPERCKAVAAIWGYDSASIEELQGKLDRRVASAFGLDGLSSILKNGLPPPVSVTAASAAQVVEVRPSAKPVALPDKPDPHQQKLSQLETSVSSWFEGKQKLGQDEARDLRSGLIHMYDLYSHSDWIGVKVVPSLKIKGSIDIPFAMGNMEGSKVSFFFEKDLNNPQKETFLQGVALAILRYEVFNPKFVRVVDWDYPKGFEDYLLYQSFASRWVPYVLQTLVDELRENLPSLLGEQLQSAMLLGLMADSTNDRQRMSELLKTSDEIKSFVVSVDSPELTQARNQALAVWDDQREAWLKLVSYNDHGMDGDLSLKAFKKVKSVPSASLIKLSNMVRDFLAPSLKCVEILDGCTRHDDFCALLAEMSSLVRDVSTDGDFYPEEIPNGKKMQALLVDLSAYENWLVIKSLIEFRDEADVVKRFQRINKIDSAKLEGVVKVFQYWNVFYNYVMPRLESRNKQWGGDILKQSQSSVDIQLGDLLKTINDLQEANSESN